MRPNNNDQTDSGMNTNILKEYVVSTRASQRYKTLDTLVGYFSCKPYSKFSNTCGKFKKLFFHKSTKDEPKAQF